MRDRSRSYVSLALTSMLALNGCVGALLGGGKPDALYRFGAAPTAATSRPAEAPRRTLTLRPPQFAPAAGGDRILTTQGNKTSYIKDMRWVSAAPALYTAAFEATVADRASDIALASRGGTEQADAVLTVKIDHFEAAYQLNEKVAPVIHVDGQAVLFDPATRKIIARYTLSAAEAASANNGPAIAAAFDLAVSDSIVQLVDWTSASMPISKPVRP